MADVFDTIVVPSANGSGASLDISGYGDLKVFTYSGDLVGCLNIEISNDDTIWVQLITITAPKTCKQAFAAQFIRATVSGYVKGTGGLTVAAVEGESQFDTVAVPATDGTGAASDLTDFGQYKTFIYDGGMNASIVLEAQQDGGDWVQFASFSARIPAVSRFVGALANVRVVVRGHEVGSPGTANISVSAVDDPSGGGASAGSFVPLGSALVTSSIPVDPPISITSRMGNGLLVNPASPFAADDLDITTPFITIQGAVDAIVEVGVANLTTALTRWIVFVAPGCYDEAVTVATTQIICIDFIAMGGVTLGAGRTNVNGGSATPRNFTWQLDGANINGVQPRLSFSTMTPWENGLYNNLDTGTIAGGPSAMNGFRISGNLVVEDLSGGTAFSGFAHISAQNLVVEGNFSGATLGDANTVLFLNNVRVGLLFSFPITVNASGGGYLWYARNCYFGYNAASSVTGKFSIDTLRFMDGCVFVWAFEATSPSNSAANGDVLGLRNCAFIPTGQTIVIPLNDVLPVDAATCLSIIAQGSTTWDPATNGKLHLVDTPSTIMWGNSDIAAAAGIVYLTPGYAAAAAGAADDKQVPIDDTSFPTKGILFGFSVRHNLAIGDGDNVTYELLVNGVSAVPAITVALASGAIGQTSVATQALIAAGARLSLKATKPVGGITDGALSVTAHARYLIGARQ